MPEKDITYRDAITEIEQILENIESEEVDVDELGLKVKRVSFLLKKCKEKLHKTEEEIENILKDIETA